MKNRALKSSLGEAHCEKKSEQRGERTENAVDRPSWEVPRFGKLNLEFVKEIGWLKVSSNQMSSILPVFASPIKILN